MKITGFPTRQIFMGQFLPENVLAAIKQHMPIEELRAEARNLFNIDAEIFSGLNGFPSITGIFDGISFKPSAFFPDDPVMAEEALRHFALTHIVNRCGAGRGTCLHQDLPGGLKNPMKFVHLRRSRRRIAPNQSPGDGCGYPRARWIGVIRADQRTLQKRSSP